MKSYRSAWLWKRVQKLPDGPLETGQIRAALGMTNETLLRWTKRRDFRTAGIAVKTGSHWIWYPRRLELWLIYIGAVKASKYMRRTKGGKRSNPPSSLPVMLTVTREDAARALGIEP